MLRTMMKGKIHRATVTDSNIDYQGSITIDEQLLEMAGIIPYEQVDIYNITNGERFTTYAIRGPGTRASSASTARLRTRQRKATSSSSPPTGSSRTTSYRASNRRSFSWTKTTSRQRVSAKKKHTCAPCAFF